MRRNALAARAVLHDGADILCSQRMQLEKGFLQHGKVSVFEHSVGVARLCVLIALCLRIRVNRRALVRGALLHDYFLYDWHVKDPSHRFHGLTHARRALDNASRDFELGSIERDMISTHMFPLSSAPPRCRESVIIVVADKLCALCEVLAAGYFDRYIRIHGL